MLHFRALEESQAAVNAVRHAGIEKRVLDDTRLRVGAVQHGDLSGRDPFVDQAPDDVDDERRFFDVTLSGESADRLALIVGRP